MAYGKITAKQREILGYMQDICMIYESGIP